MLKIAFLLIGPDAFRQHWRAILALGAVTACLALLVALDALANAGQLSHLFFGVIFAGIAAFHSMAVLQADHSAERWQRLLRLSLPATVALILLAPQSFNTDLIASRFLAAALIIDGSIRLGVALIVHIPGWRRSAIVALMQLLAAAGLIADWPLSPASHMSLALALALALAALTLVRLGQHLRQLPAGVSILHSPLYSTRSWQRHAPNLEGDDPPRLPEQPPLIMYNWTPSGAPNVSLRIPVIDRYFAVPDDDGGMSPGHVSLALGPDFYVSYYPIEEIERSSTNFINTMSGESSHNLEGFFVPSFAFEVDDWRPPTRQFLLRRFSERRLRAYWQSFREDKTYSLVNRNCAVAVGPALEAAMEGCWAGPKPWQRLLRFMLDPGLWLAALVRARADYMTWTPGFVIDYVGELNRMMDQCEEGTLPQAAWASIPGMVCQSFPPVCDEV